MTDFMYVVLASHRWSLARQLQTKKLLKNKDAQNDTDAELGISLHVYCNRRKTVTADG
jgi:hypothetical protein